MDCYFNVNRLPDVAQRILSAMHDKGIVCFYGCHEIYQEWIFRELVFWLNDSSWMILDKENIKEQCITIPDQFQDTVFFLDLRGTSSENQTYNLKSAIGWETPPHILILCEMNTVLTLDDAYTLAKPATFDLEDLRISKSEFYDFFVAQGMTFAYDEKWYAWIQGDLAIAMQSLRTAKELGYTHLEQSRESLIHSFDWILQRDFTIEERKKICILQYLLEFDIKMLDQLWDYEEKTSSLCLRLYNMGLTTSKAWNTYQCLGLFKMVLSKDVYALLSLSERQLLERKIGRYFFSKGMWQDALHLINETHDDNLAKELLGRMLSEFSIISDSKLVMEMVTILSDLLMPDSMEIWFLEMVQDTFTGNRARRWKNTQKMMAIWDDVRNQQEGFYTFSAVLIAISLCENGKFQECSEFLSGKIMTASFEIEAHYSILQFLLQYTCLVQNMNAFNIKEFIAAKASLMCEEQGNCAVMLMKMLYGHDLNFTLFQINEYDRMFEKLLQRETECATELQKLLSQILYRSYDLVVKYYPSEMNDHDLPLHQKIELSTNNNVKLWGSYMLSLEKMNLGEYQLAQGYSEDTLYYCKVVGHPLMYFKSLLLGVRIASMNHQYERAERLLNQARDLDGFSQWLIFSSALLMEEAYLMLMQKKFSESKSVLMEAMGNLTLLQNRMGQVDVLLHLCLIGYCEDKVRNTDDIRDYWCKAQKIAQEQNGIVFLDRFLESHLDLKIWLESGEDFTGKENQLHCVKNCSGIRICLFREFSLQHGDLVLEEEIWPTRKVKAIFQYLLIHPEERIARSELAKVFWPDIQDHTQSLANLRVALSLLGKTLAIIGLEDMLKRNRHRAWLEIPENAYVDYFVLKNSYEEGKACYKQKDYRMAEKHFQSSLKILEEPYLSTQSKDQWINSERKKVEKRLERCQYYLLRIALENQQFSKAVVYCRKMLEENRYREDLYRILINTLKKQGRVGEALGAYKQYKKMLQEELKINPAKEMVVMESRLKNSLL